MVAHAAAAWPDHGPCFTSRCYDAAPALAGLKPNSGRIYGAKYPGDSASRYCGVAARPWHFALTPLRLEPPMAMDDIGLACPVSLPAISRSRRISPPAPSITSPLTHKPYMSNESAHPGTAPFSPLSTGSTCLCPRPAAAVETLSLPSPSTTIARKMRGRSHALVRL